MLIVHGFAIFMLWLSGIPWIFQGLGILYLSYQCAYWYKNPYPSNTILQLNYENNRFVLYDKTGKKTSVNEVRILLDTGIFFILKCTSDNFSQKLLIFYDQLESEAYRNFFRVEKLIKWNLH